MLHTWSACWTIKSCRTLPRRKSRPSSSMVVVPGGEAEHGTISDGRPTIGRRHVLARLFRSWLTQASPSRSNLIDIDLRAGLIRCGTADAQDGVFRW